MLLAGNQIPKQEVEKTEEFPSKPSTHGPASLRGRPMTHFIDKEAEVIILCLGHTWGLWTVPPTLTTQLAPNERPGLCQSDLVMFPSWPDVAHT